MEEVEVAPIDDLEPDWTDSTGKGVRRYTNQRHEHDTYLKMNPSNKLALRSHSAYQRRSNLTFQSRHTVDQAVSNRGGTTTLLDIKSSAGAHMSDSLRAPSPPQCPPSQDISCSYLPTSDEFHA
jgi:hypothetical protein